MGSRINRSTFFLPCALLAVIAVFIMQRFRAGNSPEFDLPPSPESMMPSSADAILPTGENPRSTAAEQETDPGDPAEVTVPLTEGRPGLAVHPPASVEDPAPPAVPPTTEAAEELMTLIPAWLKESGDIRRERIQVAGVWVDRARSRYAWENESQVEVEITDLGPHASPDLIKALGFDLQLEVGETEQTIRAVQDEESYFSNLEYNPGDAEGFIQMVVEGQYLLEVKLENLPLESFQNMEDRDRVLAAVLQFAKEAR